MSIYYDLVIPCEAEEVFDYTISGGESLLLYGVDDFSEILSWLNLADLALELVPSCRESLHTCLDWFATNRQRVEVALAILKDARAKVHNPLCFALFEPTSAYQMLIERVCDGKTPFGNPCHSSHPRSLSFKDFYSEATNESKNH